MALTQITTKSITDDTISEADLDIHAAPSGTDKYLKYTSYGMEWATVSAAASDVVDDTTPQLGGNLDVNAKNILFGDSSGASDDRLVFGAGTDLSIYHDASNSYIKNTTGDFRIDASGPLMLRSDDVRIYNAAGTEFIFHGKGDGSTDLYYDNSKKFETTSYGSASAGQLRVTSSNATTPAFSCGDAGTGFYNTGSNAIGYSANGTQKWNINSSGDLRLVDSVKAAFGTSDDLLIYHDSGGDSYIQDKAGGHLYITAHDLIIQNNDTSETLAKFIEDGAIELYHDNSKRLETTSAGVNIGGNLSSDSGEHFVVNAGGASGTAGNLILRCAGENSIVGNANGSVDLYHDNTKKVATVATGIDVHHSGAEGGQVFLKDSSGNVRGILNANSSSNIGFIETDLSAWTFRVEDDGDYQHYGSELSDRDLKDNITTVTGTALDKITKLVPKTYSWKQTSDGLTPTSKTFTGFIAQEVKEHIPSLVTGTDGQKNMALDYNGLLAHAIKAIGELNEKVAALEAA